MKTKLFVAFCVYTCYCLLFVDLALVHSRRMEGEKEMSEEKEEEEEGEEKELHQDHPMEASSLDQDLPIMHWEELSQRIAELEKQEQERRERSKVSYR